MVKKNKAQMKIQQMSFMIIAVFIFFALVGMVILTVKFSDLKSSATKLEEENAMLLVTKLANSPEFSCGNSFGIAGISCVDSDKVMALKNKAEDYKGFWGTSNIEIRKIYPLTNSVECTSSSYPNCNIIKINEVEIASEYSNFVSLCRKETANGETYNKCELAKLIVGYNG